MVINNSNTTYVGVCLLYDNASISSYAFVLILIAIFATVENLVLICVIYKYKALHKPSIVLYGILACIDLFTGCVVTPIKVELTLNYSSTLLQPFLLMFRIIIFFSFATVVLISLDRFLHIYRLGKYKLTMKKLMISLAIGWLPTVIISTFWIFELHVVTITRVAIGYFFFCIAVMLLCYIGMVVEIKKNTPDNVLGKTFIEAERKAVKTTFIIIMTCFVLNIPPALDITLRFAGLWYRLLCAFTYFALLLNSVVNPMIYYWRVPLLKKHILLFLRFKQAPLTSPSQQAANNDEDLSLTDVGDAYV